MKIWVEEEYGYADYIWDPPFDSKEAFIAWWDKLDKSDIPKAVFNSPATQTNRTWKSLTERRKNSYKELFGGEWEDIQYSTDFQPTIDRLKECDGYMHIHEEFDSYITVMSIPGNPSGDWERYDSGIEPPLEESENAD